MKRGDWDDSKDWEPLADMTARVGKRRARQRITELVAMPSTWQGVGAPSVLTTTNSSTSSTGQPNVVRVNAPSVLRKRGYSELEDLPDDDDQPQVDVADVDLLAGLRNIVRPPEVKNVNVANANWCDSNGSAILLNGIATGVTGTTRVGRQCHWKSIHVKMTLVPHTWEHEACRADVFLIWDKQPGAAVLTTSDIFEAPVGGAANLCFLRSDMVDRFEILGHRYFQAGHSMEVSVAGTKHWSDTSPQEFALDFYKSLQGRQTTFKGDTALIGSIATGALYLFTIGDSDTYFLECIFASKCLYTE